jgi:hypothetical protein
MHEVDLLGDWPAWMKVLLDQRVTNLIIALATVVNVVRIRHPGKRIHSDDDEELWGSPLAL